MEITRYFVDVLRERVSEPLNFIQVVLGPRQVGKTTGVQHLARTFAGSAHYVTADSVMVPDAEWLTGEWLRARSLEKPTLLIIDEIQRVEGWSSVVKMLFDEDRAQRRLQVVLLGSASLPLHRGLAESLAGRFELTLVPHWNYAESQAAFGMTLDQYLQFGGYPAPAELIHDLRRWIALMRDAIIEPVISRDILSLASVQKPALLRQVFALAMSYPAQEVSFQKLLGQLQDKGNAATVKHYLELLEHAFIVKLLYQHSTRPITIRSSSPKILPMASALITAVEPEHLSSPEEHLGRVFESAVGAHLVPFVSKLSYWRKGKHQVDFVFSLGSVVYALEVKSGRKKSTEGLQAFSRLFPEARLILLDRVTGAKLLNLTMIGEITEFLRELSFSGSIFR